MGSDFNGDGRDDILWTNGGTGALSNWLAREDGGFAVNDANALTVAEPTWAPNWYWEVLGTGDFNGDGNDDILWTNDSLEFTNWLGNDQGGFTVNDANAFTQANPFSGNNGTAYFAGTGDFDGDGNDDVLWWDYFTSVATWSGTDSGGFIHNAAVPIDTGSGNWAPLGVGDFNGDGLDDILWRNYATGGVSDWLATGGGGFAVNDANAYHQVAAQWQIVGTGDFNGDGYDDILWGNWQDPPGADPPALVSTWLGTETGGFIINDANALHSVSATWHVAGIGDYNGDGRSDILWRNEDGTLSNWLGTESGGFAVNDAAALTHVSNDWQIGSNWDPWDY